MKQFVIESTTKWIDKQGKPHSMTSYFKAFINVVVPMLSMEKIENAKKYNSRVEALIDKRKYFGNRKGVKIVPYTATPINQ